MAQLKVDRISAAYSKLRISGLTVQPTAEDLELALNELENMMQEFAGSGLSIGYNFESEPDPNSELNVPEQFWNMINCNLACRLISDFNKTVPPTLMAQAAQSYERASATVARDRIRNVQYPTRMPIGSGNRIWGRWSNFYWGNDLPPNAPGTLFIAQGETNDYSEDFSSYLMSFEVITAFEVTCDVALVVVSSSLSDGVVNYRLRAPVDLSAGISQLVKIKITTDLGRVEIRYLNFQVAPSIKVGNN